MALLSPVAGNHIAIGPAVTDVPDDDDITLAEFTAISSWTEIDGWQNMGAHGDTRTLITEQLINRKRDIKAGGTTNGGSMQNNFIIMRDDPGQIAVRTAAKTNYNFPVRITYNDQPAPSSSVVTATIASPGVITWTGHTLQNGDAVKFSTTGALPTGLTAGTTYYVVSVASNTFSVALTPGGSAIVTSGTQSGVHTATTIPSPTVEYFYALVMSASEAGGGANTSQMLNATFEINSASVFVDAG